MDGELIVLYEDAELIVCHKRAGVPVQSARVGQKDMVSILNNYLAQTVPKKVPSIYVVHRLDQPVEGVLVFAKTKHAAAELSRQIADGRMKKLYRAVCCAASDRFEPGQSYSLVDYLARDGRTNLSSVVAQGSRDAKRAELVFHVVDRWEAVPDSGKASETYLLVEIELKTGRHHQIRVQMANAGLPLYGDQKYNARWREYLVEGGFDCWNRGGTQSEGRTQLALCAAALTFIHPATGREMTFRTEPGAC